MEHALKAGQTLGLLMAGGIDAHPEVDADGDYTGVIAIASEALWANSEPITIRVKVLP